MSFSDEKSVRDHTSGRSTKLNRKHASTVWILFLYYVSNRFSEHELCITEKLILGYTCKQLPFCPVFSVLMYTWVLANIRKGFKVLLVIT